MKGLVGMMLILLAFVTVLILSVVYPVPVYYEALKTATTL
jgi:hypothetical protein